MVRFRRIISTDSGIEGGLIRDSRDVFSREKYEERVDYQLAVLTERFHKNREVDQGQVRTVVQEFIRDVEIILRELEDMKKRVEQEEFRKINEIRSLLAKGTKVSSRKFKEKLEKFGKDLKSNAVAGLRSYWGRERRLRRGKAPMGYFLKKVRHEKGLERQIARKTGSLVEDTLREHHLAPEVDYLIRAVNAKSDEKTYIQLEERIKLLVGNYERDLDDFINIEIDIEIEEARKLHRIDHYITFLKMVGGFDNLIERLNNLKEKTNKWVYQDSIDAKKLVKYAKTLNYGLEILKSSEKGEEDFPGIMVDTRPPIYGIVPGILIHKKDAWSNRAVVIMHGIALKKERILTLAKRIASQDYIVYSIDMTAHGESKENFRLGRNSEYILTTVKWLRANGVRNVGVIGHSAGAVSTLFAMCGYNTRTENWFYNIVTRLIERMNVIVEETKKAKKPEDFEKAVNDAVLSSKEYQVLKKVILDALTKSYKGNGRIDVAVMLAAPITFQFVFPKAWAKGGRFSHKLSKTVTMLLTKGVNQLYKFQHGKDALTHKYIAKKGQVQLFDLVINDVNDFLRYVENVKNPYDFMNLIDFMCTQIKSDRQVEFFQYYKALITRIPKLYMYGLADQYLKPLRGNNMPELENHYKSFGVKEIIRYPNINHGLNKEGKLEASADKGRYPKMTYKIITFLNAHLGKGKLV